MKTESNRRVNSRMQSMARKDFPLLSHLPLSPLVSQSDKHHKELMFCMYCTVCLLCITMHKNSYSLPCLSYTGDFLIEDSLITGSSRYGNDFGNFCGIKKDGDTTTPSSKH